jgi:[acyl-carrier-protein] S-malonyltransferase
MIGYEKMKAFVFPGQGSQFVGMGKDLAGAFVVARDVFQEVDDALSQKLSKMIFEGAESDLNLTENTQPALLAVSLAVMRVLQQEKPDLLHTGKAKFVAGHSLGEYSALTAAGAFGLADAARLLKTRGLAMQKAVPQGVGAMAAILGLDLDAVVAVVKEASAGEIVTVANDNSAGQVVVSGHQAAVDRAIVLATARGAKRAILLSVSAPFHCPLMAPAAEEMRVALAHTKISAPSAPLVANVIAEAVSDPEKIRTLLVDQVTGMVRWRESVMYMKAQGVTELIEIGAGKVLTGLAKRIDADLIASAVGTPDTIENFLKSL